MRALIVSHAAVRSSNRRAYRALAARGVELSVVVPDAWTSGLGSLIPEPEPAGSAVRLLIHKRFGISHSNAYGLLHFTRAVREIRPDAIYVDEDPASITALQAAISAQRYNAGLVVLAIQNLFKRYPLPFSNFQRFVFAQTTCAVSVSEQAAQTLRKRGFCGDISPMPFTTDLVPPAPDQRAADRRELQFQAPVAGFVGRLVPEKGVDVFLQAVAQLAHVRAAIVGDGPERAALERMAKELNCADRVRFFGAQSPLETARILGALDVMVLPSRTCLHWAEQFGRVLIEAMALGVPVVASDSGAIPEVVADAGILVSEGSPDGLATGIRHAIHNGDDYKQRGIARVDRYYRSAAEVDGLYAALLRAAKKVKAAACA